MDKKFVLSIIWLISVCGIPFCSNKGSSASIKPMVGEYLRNDYLAILDESKSPLQAIQCGPVQSIAIKSDTNGFIFQSILGFQEGGPVYLLRRDGKIIPVDRIVQVNQTVSIKILDSNRIFFGFGDNKPTTYTFVGDVKKIVTEKCIAGRYIGKNNTEYCFNNDGSAIFPDKKFMYQIGLFYPPSFKWDYYTSDYEDFAYKFHGDTLKIFSVDGGSFFEGGKVQETPWLILRKVINDK